MAKDQRKRNFKSPGNYRRPNDRKQDETHHVKPIEPRWPVPGKAA